MAIQTVTCPHCHGLSKVDDSQPHASFRCPHCLSMMALAQAESQLPKTTPQLQCPLCSGRFQLPENLAGNVVRCPHCSETVRVPDGNGAQYMAVDMPPPSSGPQFAAAERTGQISGVESTVPEISQAPAITDPVTAPLDHESKPSSSQSNRSFVIEVGDQQVTLRDKGRIVEYRGVNLPVRELSRDEKAKRRRGRNLFLGIGCLVLLVVIAALLINAG